MSTKVSAFGSLPDGTQLHRYTLTNANGTTASFTDLGGIWLTMLVRDKEGKLRDVILGADDIGYLTTNGDHMGEIVGRNANRIGTASFEIDGKTWRMEANDNGRNNLHSGNSYWRNRIWKAEYEEEGNYVAFSLHSPDGDQGFPGNADVSVTYTLGDDDSLSLHYVGHADQNTIFNMTNHAYFNLAGYDTGDAMDQIVWINADSFTPADEESIPYGTVIPVRGTPMDFTTAKPIWRDLHADYEQLRFAGGYDHNWVLNDFTGKVRLSATAYSEKSGIRMSMYTDREGLQFYTANYLSGDFAGKNGVHFGKQTGFCMETQHYPDCVHKKDWPTSIVKAGETYDTTTIYKWETV